jgi:hypothetical protein
MPTLLYYDVSDPQKPYLKQKNSSKFNWICIEINHGKLDKIIQYNMIEWSPYFCFAQVSILGLVLRAF